MRVSLGSKHTKTKFSDKYVLESTLDDLTTAYNYTMDSGETGKINMRVSNRTYSIKFQSISVEGVCHTAVVDLKLVMEGPIEITASGEKSDEAVKRVELMRYALVIQSRSFVHFEIITSLNESLTKRDPKLCTHRGKRRGQRLLKSRNSKSRGISKRRNMPKGFE
uniref:60S ribosomal protein L15 n=1 Tax=Lygus hesperus TaxID=30085 RepID=A0A0A9ZGC9_LYGHE